MVNENLKNALHHAGLTTEEFSDIVRVDPKTVQRWLAGASTPYPRHRATIARALDLREGDLWPEHVPTAGDVDPHGRPSAGDVIGSWGRANDATAPDPIQFLNDAVGPIDLLDSDGTLLDTAGLLDALRERAFDGCDIRILAATNPQEPQSLINLKGVAVRVARTQPAFTLMRVGNSMLLVFPPVSTESRPLLQLTRQSDNGLFDRLAGHLDELWDTAEIITKSPDRVDRDPKGDGVPSPGWDSSVEAGRPDEQAAPVSQDQAARRRWPNQPN